MHAVELREHGGHGAEVYAKVERASWNSRPGHCELFYFNEDGPMRVNADEQLVGPFAFSDGKFLVLRDDPVRHDQILVLTHDGTTTYEGGPPLRQGLAEHGGRSVYDPRVPAPGEGEAQRPDPQAGTGESPESDVIEPRPQPPPKLRASQPQT